MLLGKGKIGNAWMLWKQKSEPLVDVKAGRHGPGRRAFLTKVS